jgi:predicted RNase H-like nuclease (RuvC/YqgF family)
MTREEPPNAWERVKELRAEVERLTAENKRLIGQIETVRELREFDKREINRLRTEMGLRGL